jgi:hexosaminidase
MILVPQPTKCVLTGGESQLLPEHAQEFLATDLAPEAYRLTISSRAIRIEASAAAGFFYGRQTLQQCQAQRGAAGLACVMIEDAPAFPERGYMLDISRCRVPTMETLKRLIDLLCHFKYNQLQLYLEHTFAYVGHEQVWADSSPLTPDDIQQLDAYARERYIELVPNQNSFGHFERWLKHPEYQHYAECPDGFIHPISGVRKSVGSTLCPTDASLDLIRDLYAQLLPHFSSTKFNVGCDEPWELGQGRTAQLFPGKSRPELFFGFLEKIAAEVRQSGRELYFWADAALEHPEHLHQLPQQACAVLWGYEADHPFDRQCAQLRDAGIPFVLGPGDSTWLSFTGRYALAEQNIPAAARAAQRYGARGLLLTHWGDQGHAQPWPTLLPGLVLAGAHFWQPQQSEVSVAAALDRFIFQDSSATLGAWLCELGRLDARLGTARFNRSLLYGLLRHSPFPADSQEASDSIDFDQLEHEINSFEAKLERARPSCDDAQTLLAECGLMLDLLRAARTGSGAGVSAELKGSYQALWLTRYRAGGLAESLQGFHSQWEIG